MRGLGRMKLADALAEWGAHEAAGRWQRSKNGDLGDRQYYAEAVEMALITRSPLVWRLLAAWPAETLRVEISAEDIPGLILADARSVSEWTEAVISDDSDGGRHIRRMADSIEQVRGPLLCSAQKTPAGQLAAPIVIFDGWHRVAAWALQIKRRAPYPLSANLLVTRHAVRLLGR